MQPVAAGPAIGAARRRYAIVLLMLIYVLNMVDRQVVTVLAEPIKLDLHLADWQIGLMGGMSFALFYTVLGLPIARLAERADRPLIISAAVVIWSGFTVLCGVAQTFVQLIGARVGVGVGESGCTPAAMSLISDYTPREKRASALSLYHLGGPIGGLIGFGMSGLVADALGWRAAFLVAGAPGLLLALIAASTLPEPRRTRSRGTAAPDMPRVSEALGELARCRTFWRLAFAIACQSAISYGTVTFIGSHLFRNHPVELAALAASIGLKPAGFLGVALGLTFGITSGVGTFAGGRLGDRAARSGLRGYATIPTVGALAAVPFGLAALLAPSVLLALVLLASATLFNALWLGPCYAAVQGLVQPRTRATATAVLLLIASFFGLGCGPLAVGALSDGLSALGLGSGRGVQLAIMAVQLMGLPAAALFWSARRHIAAETVS